MSPAWNSLYYRFVQHATPGVKSHMTYRQHGLHNFTNDTAEEETYNPRENQRGIAPEPYAPCIPGGRMELRRQSSSTFQVRLTLRHRI